MQSLDLSQNYFELFGLKPVFDVDRSRLRAEQRRLQASYHPDRHVNASEGDRRRSGPSSGTPAVCVCEAAAQARTSHQR